MFVTEPGIVTLVSPLQPQNAEDPMLVTEFGIVTVAGHAPFIVYAIFPNTSRPSGWLS